MLMRKQMVLTILVITVALRAKTEFEIASVQLRASANSAFMPRDDLPACPGIVYRVAHTLTHARCIAPREIHLAFDGLRGKVAPRHEEVDEEMRK